MRLPAWLRLAGLGLVFGAGSAHAQASSTAPSPLSLSQEALLKKVDAHYNHLTSLRARYTERYTGMGLDRAEGGLLLLKKPGRMLWRYDTPAGKVFVLDGKFGTFYTPGDAQAERISAKQMDDLRTPLRFLLGHTELKKELGHLTVTEDGGGYRIEGTPKGMDARVHKLSLRVMLTGVIVGMRLEEVDGATTEFTFSDMQENVPSRDSDFTFVPPAGVTVVNGAAPI